MAIKVHVPNEPLAELCRRWKVRELSLFGSVLRDDFRADSDVDVLVEFQPDARWRYYELMDMRAEIERLIGRRVDLTEKRVVENGPNPIRRRHILAHRETLYVA